MKAWFLGLGVIAAAVSLAVGPHTASAVDQLGGPFTQIAVAHSGLGSILVDGRGRTLYLFEKDKGGKSACSGQCARSWPPLLTSGKPLGKAGVKASLLGTIRRANGRLQVTYNRHPLYTFVEDARKGQTTGEGVEAFGAEWYVVSAAGAKVERSGGTAPSGGYGAGGYGAGGYGY
jgi:predicted lipoprotein with Yx(FWY)xxD motif